MLLFGLFLAAAQPATSAPAPAPSAQAPGAPAVAQGVVTTPSGVRFQTLQAGDGPRPSANAAVLVMYEGRLADGTLFDASAQPVPFGVQDVIPGFTEALLMMNRGGRYRFWIPGHLAYGPAGAGAIPPNAELDFTVTLLDIAEFQPAPEAEPAPAQ
jgi:FKBP-type peptidyl-prolyl cis-trans isomerase